MSAAAVEARLTGKHVLLILVGFFGVVFAVNSVFVTAALMTRPGEESGASYESGLRYNATLAEERTQDVLRWSHKSEIQSSRVRVAITNAEHAPVAGLAVIGKLGRPASNSSDRELAFQEIEPGRYEANIDAIGTGSWVLAFTAQKKRAGSDQAVFRMKERLWLSPAR